MLGHFIYSNPKNLFWRGFPAVFSGEDDNTSDYISEALM